MKKIILASGSPRRKELLQMLIGESFEIMESSYREDNTLKMSPKDLVLYHSLEKGKEVASRIKQGLVIAADTIVVFENEVLGKPHTADKAREMLNKINGKAVEVITGIAVIEDKRELQDFELTKVKMKQMTEKEIKDYVNSGEPLDKAGAFGIQGKAAVLIERIQGDYFNIVGLPLFKLNNLLEEFRVNIFDF